MASDSTSDKVYSVNNLQRKQGLRKAILELYDDGYTVHEISESLAGVHCSEIAEIISEAIKDEAERCA